MSELTIAWSPSAFGAADDAPLRLLESLGISVRPNPFGRRLTEEEAIEHLAGVDGLIAGLEPLGRPVLETARARLKAIARVGIGMDNVDQDAADEFGIRVSNTPDGPTASVAELTLAAALSLTRRLPSINRSMHEARWEKVLSSGLRNVPVLLVGFGRIGREVAGLFSAFGAQIMVTDPYYTPEPGITAEVVDLEDGLSRAEVVSLHAAGRECILGEDELSAMKEGAVLLNSARGELVDHDALLAALDAGRVGGAWFDVFWEEPYDGALTEYEQVLLTPHVGTYTSSCRREMEMAATRNLLRDLGVETDQ